MLGILWYIAYGSVVLGLSVYGIHRMWMIVAYFRCKSQRSAPPRRFETLPVVTVQLPLFNERCVAERLLRSVAALDYPRDRLEVQVLDDSTDETSDIVARVVAELSASGLDIVHLRRTDRTGFKAGALEAGLHCAKGEFLAIFDADFVPPSGILRETVDHFTDAGVGMVQTRWGHINRCFSLLTRVQALLLDGHLIIEQTVRNRWGRFFNFNGTAGIWRKSCIIEAGGWQHDTLTEDLDLSYRAQMVGWRFVFLPHLVTPAELPVDMNAFKTQQHRWAKGAVQTCKKLLPVIWRSELPWYIKVEATFHLTANFAYLLLALMAFLIIPDPAGNPTLAMLFGVHLPIFCMASLSVILFYALVLREVGVTWWKWFGYLPMLIAMGIGLSLNNARAVIEAVLNQKSPFARTPKFGITGRGRLTSAPSAYLSPRSWIVLLEAALFIHYARFSWQAWNEGLWVSLPFFVLFCFGFGYTASTSIRLPDTCLEWLGRLRLKIMHSNGI